MEYRYTLTKKDQEKLFFYGYYNTPIIILKFQRKFVGPLLLIIALLEVFINAQIETIGFSLFLSLFGLYYIFRPFILRKKYKFKDVEINIITAKDKIKFILPDDNVSSIGIDNLKNIICKGNYIFLKIQISTTRFFIIDLTKIEENADQLKQEILNFKLT